MILIACVDDRWGMLFNHRRQSRDNAVIAEILKLSAGERLWMNHYSRGLFPSNAHICEDDHFLMNAAQRDYCFVEDCDIAPYLCRVHKIVLFFWNRSYPADLYFPKEALDSDWSVNYSLDFSGSSHEKITLRVYSR